MFERFKTRSERLERIDTGDYTPEEYARWQQEMVFIHRWLGETRAIKRKLISKLHGSTLDIGAGSGELLKTVDGLSKNTTFLCGIDLELDAAKSIFGRGFAAAVGNGDRLPFADDSFDNVISSLVFHHLPDQKAAGVLREMMRVSKGKVFVIDLRRSALAYYGYRSLAYFLFQRLTREDGSLSVLRSFTDVELRNIAEKAGLHGIKVERSAPFRLVLSGNKSELNEN